MLQILINAEPVDLPLDASITIEEESPVFGTSEILGGFGFPFNLPVTPRNSRILNFPERPGNVVPLARDYDFDLIHSGIPKLSGTITVRSAGNNYECYLVVGTGNLASKITNKKLADLELGGSRTWSFLPEYVYPESDFAIFPIDNVSFMLESAQEVAFSNSKFRINAYEGGQFFQDSFYCFAITPFPFLGYVVKKVFSEHGFQIVENRIETDSDLKDLVIYSTKDISTLIQVPYSFEGNDYVTTERGLGQFHLADCVPDMTIKDFILWLRNRFNIAFLIDGNNQVRIIKRQDIILSSSVDQITDFAIGSSKIISIEKPSGYALKWNHDSDDEMFGAEYFKDIEGFLDLLQDPVPTYADLDTLDPEVNEIHLVESEGVYWQYGKTLHSSGVWIYQWQQWSIGYQNYLIGDREEEFSSGFSTLQMTNYHIISTGKYMRCPITQQKGNPLEADEYRPFSARLLFYRGMQLDNQSELCPMGSNDNRNRSGNVIPGKNLTLFWEGEYGIYNQLWKKYLTWWTDRKQVNWLITDPSMLDFAQKYNIDGNHYLLKRRTIHLTANEIIPGECEWYLV